MTELLFAPYKGLEFDTKFFMESIEVDGICSIRSTTVVDNPILSLKQEENMFGEPDDTGALQQVNFSFEVSEKHWLKCGTVIPKHSRCFICEERDLDE